MGSLQYPSRRNGSVPPGLGRLLWISHLFSRFAPGPRLVIPRQAFVRRCQSIGCSYDVASAPARLIPNVEVQAIVAPAHLEQSEAPDLRS
jgi:hypothetical protein